MSQVAASVISIRHSREGGNDEPENICSCPNDGQETIPDSRFPIPGSSA
jgi:hypothetical protein